MALSYAHFSKNHNQFVKILGKGVVGVNISSSKNESNRPNNYQDKNTFVKPTPQTHYYLQW